MKKDQLTIVLDFVQERSEDIILSNVINTKPCKKGVSWTGRLNELINQCGGVYMLNLTHTEQDFILPSKFDSSVYTVQVAILRLKFLIMNDQAPAYFSRSWKDYYDIKTKQQAAVYQDGLPIGIVSYHILKKHYQSIMVNRDNPTPLSGIHDTFAEAKKYIISQYNQSLSIYLEEIEEC